MIVAAVIEKPPPAAISKSKEILGTAAPAATAPEQIQNYMPLSPSQQLLLANPGRLSPIQQGAASDYVQMDVPKKQRISPNRAPKSAESNKSSVHQMPSSDYVLMGVDPHVGPAAIHPDPPSSTGNDSGFTTDDSLSNGAGPGEPGQQDKAPAPHRPLIAQVRIRIFQKFQKFQIFQKFKTLNLNFFRTAAIISLKEFFVWLN